jgi:RNA polymerase sigma factor for flagellar operon FliA
VYKTEFDFVYKLFANKLEDNISSMNSVYKEIMAVFTNTDVSNFEKLPDDMPSRSVFACLFKEFNEYLEASIIQGFKWKTELKHKSIDYQLWKEYLDSPTVQNEERIVKRYLPLVKYVARKTIAPSLPTLDHKDLSSFEVFCLLVAMDRCDISKGFSFQTFTVPSRRGLILDELHELEWISRAGREKLQALNRAMDKVLQERGILHDEYLIEEMGVEEKSYRETIEMACRTYFASIDDIISFEDAESPFEEALPHDDESAKDIPENEDEMKRVTSTLNKMVEYRFKNVESQSKAVIKAKLDEKTYQILALRYEELFDSNS